MRRKTLEDCQEAAKKRGGKCLSKIYKNRLIPMDWECGEGHTWTTDFGNIKRGRWCPECGEERRRQKSRKYTIEEMRGLAEKKGGKCLSDKYISAYKKLIWQCKCGNIWKTIPRKIMKGRWCPKCGGTEKLTLDHAKELAKIRGGECIAEYYPLSKMIKVNKLLSHSLATKTSKD